MDFLVYISWFISITLLMYNLIKTYKINKLKKQIIELENNNKILLESQKDQTNNNSIIKEMHRTLENNITNIIEVKNNKFVLFTNNILQKLDTHIKCNYETIISEQEEKISKQTKELKIREQIINHLRNKDLDNMVEKYEDF
jgi:hypothetical protein